MPLTVVVDTNVWVSATLNPAGQPARVLAEWAAGRFTVATSVPLLEELADVLDRPRIRVRYGLDPDEAARLVDLLAANAVIVPVSGQSYGCRDADDDAVIETAIRAGATAVVTRDDDLKDDTDLQSRLDEHGVMLTSVRRFLASLEPGEHS